MRSPDHHSRPQASPARLVALLAVGGTLIAVGIVSTQSLQTLLSDGLIAAAVLACATGLGELWLRLLGLQRIETRWRMLLAAGLGIGSLSLLMLALGSLGLLQRWLWLAILAAGAAAGLYSLARKAKSGITGESAQTQNHLTPESNGSSSPPSRLVWLWLLVIPFAATAILASSVPPGLLWPEEGNGYDVLEYHLAAPREYFEAGRIGYLPHNIYSNFPFNVEMHYLLSMVLHGDPVAAVFTAQMLNFWLGVLAVAAIWLAAREISPIAGILAGVAAATCPMLTYLSGIAYVENGLVLFTALALAATIRLCRSDRADCLKWAAAAGLFAGLACGCKYTAIPMVAAPLLLSISMLSWRGNRRPVAGPLVYAACAVGAFAPWMAKNVVHTGNPLFPLARSVFHEREGLWTDADADRWTHGHRLAEADRPWWPRMKRAWLEITLSSRYGGLIGCAAFCGAFLSLGLAFRSAIENAAQRPHADPRQTQADALGTANGWDFLTAIGPLLLAGFAVWLFATHMAGRFAVTLLPSAAVLIAMMSRRPQTLPIRILVIMITLFAVTCALGIYTSASKAGVYTKAPFGRDLLTIVSGVDPAMADDPIGRINALTAKGHRVLLVAEARRFYYDRGVDYCVIFSRNPLAEAAAQRDPAGLLAWLRGHKYDYVYVDWLEMDRFRQTYGFWPALDPALFQRLESAGLQRLRDFRLGESERVYSTLYSTTPTSTPQ